MHGRDLARYARDSGRFLVEEYGFTLSGRRYTRSDELIRSCWFTPLNATPEKYFFDVLVDVGIPGISAFGPREQTHVVRANAQHAARGGPDSPRPEFRLIAAENGRVIAPGADDVVRQLVDDLLLRYDTPAELYQMVRASALLAVEQGARTDDDFGRLALLPPNAAGRLELAAVYGAFLGRDDEVAELLAVVRQYAPAHRVEYMIPRIDAGVAEARQARTAA
jgi:hypothetical protein